MAAIPISIGLGAPVSTAFLELDGVFGLAGWKWLFLGEAAPAVIFGIICFFFLTDRPINATWLSDAERRWLDGEMQKEKKTLAEHRSFSVLETLWNPRVLALAAISGALSQRCSRGLLLARQRPCHRDADDAQSIENHEIM